MVSAQPLFSTVHSELGVSAVTSSLGSSVKPRNNRFTAAQIIVILLKNGISIFVAAVLMLCYVIIFEIKY